MLIVVEELFLCVGQVVDWRRILDAECNDLVCRNSDGAADPFFSMDPA